MTRAKRRWHQRVVIWVLVLSAVFGLMFGILMYFVSNYTVAVSIKGALLMTAMPLFVLGGFSIDFVRHRRRSDDPDNYGPKDFTRDVWNDAD